jgi:hypothetical protein
MGGRLLGAIGAGAALGAGAFRVSAAGCFFLDVLLFFVLSMGSLGGIMLKLGR